MRWIKTLAVLAFLMMMAAPAAADEPLQNTSVLDALTQRVEVKAESEFPAVHAAAAEMRRLRVEAVELRRLAARFAAQRALRPRR